MNKSVEVCGIETQYTKANEIQAVPLQVTLVHLAITAPHMFTHGPFFFPPPTLSIVWHLKKPEQMKLRTKREDASQFEDTESSVSICDDSIATLLTEEKAEQQQKPDPWFWCRTAGFYSATSTPLWKRACV